MHLLDTPFCEKGSIVYSQVFQKNYVIDCLINKLPSWPFISHLLAPYFLLRLQYLYGRFPSIIDCIKDTKRLGITFSSYPLKQLRKALHQLYFCHAPATSMKLCIGIEYSEQTFDYLNKELDHFSICYVSVV